MCELMCANAISWISELDVYFNIIFGDVFDMCVHVDMELILISLFVLGMFDIVPSQDVMWDCEYHSSLFYQPYM